MYFTVYINSKSHTATHEWDNDYYLCEHEKYAEVCVSRTMCERLGRGMVEDMEFPGTRGIERACENSSGQLKKKWNFQGCLRKAHVEFPFHVSFF